VPLRSYQIRQQVAHKTYPRYQGLSNVRGTCIRNLSTLSKPLQCLWCMHQEPIRTIKASPMCVVHASGTYPHYHKASPELIHTIKATRLTRCLHKGLHVSTLSNEPNLNAVSCFDLSALSESMCNGFPIVSSPQPIRRKCAAYHIIPLSSLATRRRASGPIASHLSSISR
jgi:hypothetical protein